MDLKIVNQALVALKSRPIQAGDESTDKAVTAATFWDDALDEVLRGHFWNFAIVRKTLNPLQNAQPGFSYAYQKPTDWLRTIEVVGLKNWKHEGTMILCNSTPIVLRYIRRVTKIIEWDALAKQVLVQNLAAKMAYGITESATKEKVHWEKYVALKGQAASVDAQEEPADEIEESSLLTSRF